MTYDLSLTTPYFSSVTATTFIFAFFGSVTACEHLCGVQGDGVVEETAGIVAFVAVLAPAEAGLDADLLA